MDFKELSVVIATWNARDYLSVCLSSIYQNTSGFDFEIIVVDNNSSDGTSEMLTMFPEVKVVKNRANRGVAAARNQGIELAGGRFVVLLDSDTLVMPKALNILADFMDNNPRVGLAGPKLVNGDYKLHLSCRNFPTVLSKVLRRVPLSSAKEFLRKEELADWDHDSIREVDYVIGACQIIRREAINEVGLLDDNIFYGPEDVDYCIRIWRKGWAVCYNPYAMIVHYEQRATKKLLTRLTWLHLKGLVYYFLKYRYLFDTLHLRGDNKAHPLSKSSQGKPECV